MLKLSDKIVDALHSFFMPCVALEKIMLMCWMRVSNASQGVSKTIVQNGIVTALGSPTVDMLCRAFKLDCTSAHFSESSFVVMGARGSA